MVMNSRWYRNFGSPPKLRMVSSLSLLERRRGYDQEATEAQCGVQGASRALLRDNKEMR